MAKVLMLLLLLALSLTAFSILCHEKKELQLRGGICNQRSVPGVLH